MPGNVTDATTAYFGVTLVTVLICVQCYRVLMRLPESEHVMSQMVSGYISPTGDTYVLLKEDNEAESQVGPLAGALKGGEKASSFGNVWRIAWRNQSVIFLNLFITTLCYPGLITSIRCRQMFELQEGHWFQTLLLTAFTMADILGRFMTRFRMGLHHGNIQIVILVRAMIFPLILYCITD